MTTLHALLGDERGGGAPHADAFLQPYWSPRHEDATPIGGAEMMLVEAVSQRLTWGLHRWRPHPDAFNTTFAEQLWTASEAACSERS